MKKRLTHIIVTHFLLCLAFCLSYPSYAQVDIDKIDVEKGSLIFWIKCMEDGKPKRHIKKRNISIKEFINDEETGTLLFSAVVDSTVYVEEKEKEEKPEILNHNISFLLDLSREMDEGALRKAKDIIHELVMEQAVDAKTKFYLTAYHDATVYRRKRLTPETVKEVLSELKVANNAPDFYNFLVDEFRHLKGLEGKGTLFILGSGVNVAEGEMYTRRLPHDQGTVKRIMESLSGDFHLFTINMKGEDASANFDFLNSEFTRHTNGELPADYAAFLGQKNKIKSNYLIKASPNWKNPIYKGEKRKYVVSMNGEEGVKDFQLGGINDPINMQSPPEWSSWLLLLAVGIILILLILGVGSVLVPYLREEKFIKEYVEPYVRKNNLVQYDVIYNEPIKEGAPVVKKCQQVTPFSTWKEVGWQCPNYADCGNPKCGMAGAPEANSFFSMEGIFLKLNWIWFGTIGGLLAWIIMNLFRITDFQLLNSAVAEGIFPNAIGQSNPELLARTIGNNMLVGVAFGAGLLFMLGWMEERRASNRYSYVKAVMRILLRTIAGILWAMLVFFFGFYLQYELGIGAYLSGLISWLFFGLGVGLIISIRSSIAMRNGVVGGIIGAVIAFQFYWLLSEILEIEFMVANLLSMILMGGLIGSVLVSVVTNLEDFELEVIAPQGYQRTIPISKWLKSNIGVMIGKLPCSYIYIKWDDEEVQPEHAELFREDGKVFIKPLEEILINKKIISKPVPLRNGDTIQLGRASITQFRFMEK